MRPLYEQAEALRRAAEQQQAEQRRAQQQVEAANRVQQLIRSQQEQQQQLQNSFNKLANDVSESIREKNRGERDGQPSVVWQENRQEYRSRNGGPAPRITYKRKDGTVESGIPIEAIVPQPMPG